MITNKRLEVFTYMAESETEREMATELLALRAEFAAAKEQLERWKDEFCKVVRARGAVMVERDEAIAARAETERKLAEANHNVSDNVQTIGRLDAECLRLRNRAEAAERDATILKMRAALEAARGEITRMATDGGGFSCSVIDEIDKALNGAAKAALEAVSDEKQTTDYSI